MVQDYLNERGQLAKAFYSKVISKTAVEVNGVRGGQTLGIADCNAIGGCRRNDCPMGRIATASLLEYCEQTRKGGCDMAFINSGKEDT